MRGEGVGEGEGEGEGVGVGEGVWVWVRVRASSPVGCNYVPLLPSPQPGAAQPADLLKPSPLSSLLLFSPLLFSSLHSTSLHFASLHFTSLHFTSLDSTRLDLQVGHVVLFDFPRDGIEYVRRVGRTTRGAQVPGRVTSLVLGRQLSYARSLMKANREGAAVDLEVHGSERSDSP